MVEYLKKTEKKESLDPQDVLEREDVKVYGEAVSKLFDEGESEETLADYKNSVLKLMFGSDEGRDMSSGPTENQKDDPSPDGVEGKEVV